MIVKLLTEHHLKFLSLKRGCRGLSESTHVKIPHYWKSHALAHIIRTKNKGALVFHGIQVNIRCDLHMLQHMHRTCWAYWGCMHGSRNFRQGGGVQVSLTKKALKGFFAFFLILNLFYRSQMVNFKEIYHFSRFQRGSNIFQRGSNCIFPIETHITYDFPEGVRTPCFQGGGPDPLSPPLDPHLG